MKTIYTIIGVTLFILITGLLLQIAVTRSEAVECQKLAKQAEEYPNFFYADWQIKQCNIK